MSHKDAPPETPSQIACREFWERAQPTVTRAWGRAQDGSFLAEESRLLHKAWEAASGEAVVILRPQPLKLGNYGGYYDPPRTHRAFTYAHQPDNLLASRLGGAFRKAAAGSAGDGIDQGLGLLRTLQEAGFGVFQIDPQQPATLDGLSGRCESRFPDCGPAVAWDCEGDGFCELCAKKLGLIAAQQQGGA